MVEIHLLDDRRPGQGTVLGQCGTGQDRGGQAALGVEPYGPARGRAARRRCYREAGRRLGTEGGDAQIDQLDGLPRQVEAVELGMHLAEAPQRLAPAQGVERAGRHRDLDLVVLAGIAHVGRSADVRVRQLHTGAQLGDSGVAQPLDRRREAGKIKAVRIGEMRLNTVHARLGDRGPER